MARLTPFVDDEGFMRVGGRLRYSDASDNFKFPILLPKSYMLSTFIISHYHLQHLHGSPQLVASYFLHAIGLCLVVQLFVVCFLNVSSVLDIESLNLHR